jgi:hypothetical protein
LVKASLFICALKTSQGAEAPLFFVFGVFGARMSSAPFALFLRVIRAPGFGRAYSAAPHAFPCSPLPTSTETGGRRSQIFDFKPDVVLTAFSRSIFRQKVSRTQQPRAAKFA